jgi:hypothetical protein
VLVLPVGCRPSFDDNYASSVTETETTSTGAPYRRRALLVGVAVVSAVALAIAIGTAVFGGSDRVLRLEVTSPSGEAQHLNWSGPDDGYALHEPGFDPAEPMKTTRLPWSMDLEITATQGPIRLNASSFHGSWITCRITRGDTVLEEKTSTNVANCMVSVQRAFATS